MSFVKSRAKTLAKAHVAGIAAAVAVVVLVAVGLGVGLGVDWKTRRLTASTSANGTFKEIEGLKIRLADAVLTMQKVTESWLRLQNAKSRTGSTKWWWNNRYKELLPETKKAIDSHLADISENVDSMKKAVIRVESYIVGLKIAGNMRPDDMWTIEDSLSKIKDEITQLDKQINATRKANVEIEIEMLRIQIESDSEPGIAKLNKDFAQRKINITAFLAGVAKLKLGTDAQQARMKNLNIELKKL